MQLRIFEIAEFQLFFKENVKIEIIKSTSMLQYGFTALSFDNFLNCF